jgi:hypothetical protein
MMSFTKSYDRWIGLILLIVAAILFANTFTFKTRPFVPLNTAFWPRVVLAGMSVVSVYLIVRGRVSPEEPEKFPRNAVYAFLAFVLYVAILPYGGFFAVSGVIGAAGYFWLSEVKTMRTAVIAVIYGTVVSGAIYMLFKFALLVQLPKLGGF